MFKGRSQRLKRRDYELGEAEKTHGYNVWLIDAHRREVKEHSTQLNTERLKDGLTALDMEERKTLGLTDEENENAKARIQLEDFIKARAVSHSVQDKAIAENLLAKAKADKEIRMFFNCKLVIISAPPEYEIVSQLSHLKFLQLPSEKQYLLLKAQDSSPLVAQVEGILPIIDLPLGASLRYVIFARLVPLESTPSFVTFANTP